VKKKKPPVLVRYKFAAGRDDGWLPLSDHEAQLQRQAHAMAVSEDLELRQIGKAQLKQAAERLAKGRLSALLSAQSRKKATPLAAAKRREIGEGRAKLVKDAIAQGKKPPAGKRHVRRIMNRQNR
jgi:hypothetical protein